MAYYVAVQPWVPDRQRTVVIYTVITHNVIIILAITHLAMRSDDKTFTGGLSLILMI